MALVRFASDANLILLPKRAFPDAPTIAGFRDIVTERVAAK
jgi:hypothetical protein